jgi:hypothetical protein
MYKINEIELLINQALVEQAGARSQAAQYLTLGGCWPKQSAQEQSHDD